MRMNDYSWNNLNIPPSTSNSGNLGPTGSGWSALVHLLAPAALGYVYWRGQHEKDMLVEGHQNEIRILQKQNEKELSSLSSKQNRYRNDPVVEKITEITNAEEQRRNEMMEQLQKVEDSLKLILDIRCSRGNPWKTKAQREQLEYRLLRESLDGQLASLRMYDGLTQVFTHDHVHCGGGYNRNGQLYRVWMQHWRAMVMAESNRRIADTVKSLLESQKSKESSSTTET